MPSATTLPSFQEKRGLAVPKPTMPTRNEHAKPTKRKIICFSDFDGTIFMQDTGHILFDAHGCGPTRRQILDAQIHSGERSFRDVSEEMWGSLSIPFEDGFDVMREKLEIDPDFRNFHTFCIERDIPFNVISAGLKPVLRRVLDSFLGEEESSRINIVANEMAVEEEGSNKVGEGSAEEGGKWKPVWRHDTELGHDKALSITEARAEAQLACDDGTIPLIVFIGDGVSDLPAAREADVLFARRGLRLEEYCLENKIPYFGFDTFEDVRKEVEKIAKEDEEKTKGEGKPVRFNPRANLWRRVSSQKAVPVLVKATPTREEKMWLWPEGFTELHSKGVVPLGGAGITEEGLAAVTA